MPTKLCFNFDVVFHYSPVQVDGLGMHSILFPLQEVLENVFYVWALCRDQSIYDPRIAWRVLEFGIQASGKLLI